LLAVYPRVRSIEFFCFRTDHELTPPPLSLCHNKQPQAPPSADSEKGRKRTLDPNRPTAFSLLKAGGALKNATTDEKIRAMEKKLAQMAEPAKTPAPPAHASLPPKPATTSSLSSTRSSRIGNNNNHSDRSRNNGKKTRGASSSLASARHGPY